MKRAEKKQALVDHYIDFYAAALAMLKDEDDAKDAVQDALVNTLVSHGVREPYNYCMQAVRNRCVDTLRRRSLLGQLEETSAVVDPDREELLRLLKKQKEELSPTARTIVELHYEEGHSLPKVASELGLSLSSVKRTLAETKNELRKKLEI